MTDIFKCKKCGKDAEYISDTGLAYFCKNCFKERNVKTSENSYWNHLSNSAFNNSDGQLQEDVLANQDGLSESDAMFSRPLTEEGEIQLETIHSVFLTLSPQQQRVFQLCGFEGKTIDEVAKVLNLDRSTVYTLYQRAKNKIVKEYNSSND
jgi:RNA polymerase sigma factor (sigma-70 family)